MKMQRLQIISLLASLWAVSAPAGAATIDQLVSFSLTNSAPLDTLALNPFDTGLGTLDEVRVSIDGNLIHSGTLFGLIPYSINTQLDMFGLAGQFFDFGNPGVQIIHNGLFNYQTCSIAGCVPAAGPLVLPPVTFGLDFSFDRQFQELTGITQGFIDDFSVAGANAAIPPTVINGAMSDFHEPFIPLNQMNLVMSSITTGSFTSLNTSLFGSMTIIYDYTPNPIPLPAAAWLFATALIGLAGFGKRKKPACEQSDG